MRTTLIAILFSVFSLSLFAQVDLGKRIDFSATRLSLEKALSKLSKQSYISIAYSDELLPKDIQINIRFRNKTIRYILDYLLRGSGLDFKVIGTQVVLYRKKIMRSFSISGYVKDATSGERLIACHVYIPEGKRGTTSNEYGFYSLRLKEGLVSIRFSYLGYQPVTKTFRLKKNIRLDIELEPKLLLTEVLVSEKDSNYLWQLALERISAQHIKALPSLGGEPDIFRVTHLKTGIQTGADGVGGIHVRGGNADQTLYLLDGVPIYNPSHLAGIFSIYDTDAIRSSYLMKDYIPSRYGGRLSSVLEVRTKEGNLKKWHLNAGGGLTSIKGTIEGPLKKNKGAVFFSARRALLDLAVKPITKKLKERRNERGFSNYHFYDINAKVNYFMGSKDQIFLSAYAGKDRLYDEGADSFVDDGGVDTYIIQNKNQQNLDWGNRIAALRWNHFFKSKLFLNTTLTYSDYRFRSQQLAEQLEIIQAPQQNPDSLRKVGMLIFQSRIQDWAFKMDFDYATGANHYWRFGLESRQLRFYPGVRQSNALEDFPGFGTVAIDTFQLSKEQAYESSLYLEDQISLFAKCIFTLGTRATLFRHEQHNRYGLSPRVQLWYPLHAQFGIKSSFLYMYQYLHLLSNSSIGLPADLWLPTTRGVSPQKSWQGLLGLEWQGYRKTGATLNLYYKKMRNLLTFQQGVKLADIDARNWEDKVTAGKGTSYGAEFFFQKEWKHWRASIGYTWSKTTRQFDALNLGRPFPFRYDRRHVGQFNILYQINEKWRIALNWNYGSGLATSLPRAKYEFVFSPFSPVIATAFDRKNNFRLPPYHRLDVDAAYRINKKWGIQQINIGVYNVYNRRNPIYYRIGRDPDNFSKKRYLQATLFGILPYFSYKIYL